MIYVSIIPIENNAQTSRSLYSKTGVRKLWPQTKSGLSPDFANTFLLEYSHAHSFIYFSVVAFVLQQHCRLVTTETVWPTKPKIFTIWPFMEKVYQSP